jgi:glycosyltransferase involved in cell wall biosynthesis
LEQQGIATYVLKQSWLNGDDALVDFRDLLISGRFDIVLLTFWNCAEAYIPLVRSHSPTSTIIVDSIDIHFVRQSRRVFADQERSSMPGVLDYAYGNEMARELNAYAAADAVLTVSRKESELVNDLLGKRLAYELVQAEDVTESFKPFGERKGVLFIGNFRHPPNVQAVEFLCGEILPRIPEDLLTKHPIYVVGNDPDKTVVGWCEATKHVRLVGWVPSVFPYLQQVRISILPLLYGAGTKTKLIQSLISGTPSVSTSIGVEGFDIQDGRHVLVADGPTAFAAAITRLLSDQNLWESMASEGRNFMRAIHGRDAVFARFKTVIATIMNVDI